MSEHDLLTFDSSEYGALSGTLCQPRGQEEAPSGSNDRPLAWWAAALGMSCWLSFTVFLVLSESIRSFCAEIWRLGAKCCGLM